MKSNQMERKESNEIQTNTHTHTHTHIHTDTVNKQNSRLYTPENKRLNSFVLSSARFI